MSKIYSNIILLFILIAPALAVSQNSDLASAIALFDKGQFTKAEPLFKTALDQKPNDFMVNYFYGACRTENNHFTNADLDCLIKANEEVSPIDINFYFGVQYHARSNWERAMKYYNKYKSSVQLKEVSKRGVLEKIQQCYDKINPYEEYIIKENNDTIIPVIEVGSATVLADSTETETSTVTDSLSLVPDSTTVSDSLGEVALAVVEEPEKPKGEMINFVVNSEITYTNTTQFQTSEGKTYFNKWIKKKDELNDLVNETDNLRKKYAKAKTRYDKKTIGQLILANENSLFDLKEEVVELQNQAQTAEINYWKNATPDDITSFIEEQKYIEQNAAKTDSTAAIQDSDTLGTINPTVLLSDSDNAVLPEKPNNTDLVYKIQLGTYKKLPRYVKKLYDKLSLFRKIDTYTDENGVVVYTTGNLTNYADALKMKSQVKQEGVEDAKIIPYLKGKRITLEEAKELENR